MRLLLLLALFCPYSSGQEEAEILVDLSICKDLNYCNFRGKCYNLGPDSDFFCLCFHGFTGDSCSEKDRTFHGVVGPCKFRNCQNGGLCYTTEEDPESEEQCLCPPEFSGPYCSEKDEMRGIFAQFLLITVTLQHSGFKELRNSLLTLILEQTAGIDDNDQLLSRRDLWIKVAKVVMNSTSNDEIIEEGHEAKITQMIERLQDIQEKSRIYGISGTDVLMAALLMGFSPKFQAASTENRIKMIEKIIINAAPTNEEKEARNLEDMLVDASMTPNYIVEMNERQAARIDFLFEVVRIASDSKKSQEQKITAIIAQIDRSQFYTKIVEVIQNFNVVDFAERLIFEFSWIKLNVKKEEYSKLSREEKMKAVIQAIQANIKSL